MIVGKLSHTSKIRGDYALLEVMGTPGSEVFRARARDGRYVVLRFWRGDSDFASRAVVQMVEAASAVRHPMIAGVDGCERHPDCTVTIVSEYVPGRTLDRWIGDSELPHPALAVDFVRRLALGLQSAHQRGVAHHALYPGNLVVLEPDTKPRSRISAKLLDLGVPRLVRSTPKFEAAHFMAPEALAAELQNPEHPLAIDARMNVYSCGCLLHYLCTGQPPYQSDTLERLSALHRGEAKPAPSELNPEVPALLERAILHALEIEPERRLQSTAALAASLSYLESRWRSSGVRRRTVLPPPTAAKMPLAVAPAASVDGKPEPKSLDTRAEIAVRVGLVPMPGARERRDPSEMMRVSVPPAPPMRQTLPGPAPRMRTTAKQPMRLLTPEELAERAERTRRSAERHAVRSSVSTVAEGSGPSTAAAVANFARSSSDALEPVHAELAVVEPIRDSLSALELPAPDSAVQPREDVTESDRSIAPHSRPRRRWILLGSSAASLGACLTWIGLGSVPSSDPNTRIPAAQPAAVTPTSRLAHPDVSVALEAPAPPERSVERAPEPSAAAAARVPSDDKPARESGRPRTERSPAVVAGAPVVPVYRDPSDDISVSLPLRSGPSTVRVIAEPQARSTSPRVVRLGDAWTTPTVVTVIETGPVRSNGRPTARLEPSTAVTPGALRTENIDVRGSLATSIVRRAIDRIRPQLLECYRQNSATEQRIPEPTTQVELTIDEVGRVKNSRVHGPLSPKLNECLHRASQKLVSGPPDTGTVKVSWRMRYGR